MRNKGRTCHPGGGVCRKKCVRKKPRTLYSVWGAEKAERRGNQTKCVRGKKKTEISLKNQGKARLAKKKSIWWKQRVQRKRQMSRKNANPVQVRGKEGNKAYEKKEMLGLLGVKEGCSKRRVESNRKGKTGANKKTTGTRRQVQGGKGKAGQRKTSHIDHNPFK